MFLLDRYVPVSTGENRMRNWRFLLPPPAPASASLQLPLPLPPQAPTSASTSLSRSNLRLRLPLLLERELRLPLPPPAPASASYSSFHLPLQLQHLPLPLLPASASASSFRLCLQHPSLDCSPLLAFHAPACPSSSSVSTVLCSDQGSELDGSSDQHRIEISAVVNGVVINGNNGSGARGRFQLERGGFRNDNYRGRSFGANVGYMRNDFKNPGELSGRGRAPSRGTNGYQQKFLQNGNGNTSGSKQVVAAA